MTIQNFKIKWADFPGPCYDPQDRYGDCPATFLDLINDGRVPTEDRIWAFVNCEKVPDSAKRMFAVRCIRETPCGKGFVFNRLTDERSVNAVVVAEKHANGLATDEELDAAWDAAWAAARDAARDAAWDAAWAAAGDVAWAAAGDVAGDVAWAAAWAAAGDVAWAAQLSIIKSMIK